MTRKIMDLGKDGEFTTRLNTLIRSATESYFNTPTIGLWSAGARPALPVLCLYRSTDIQEGEVALLLDSGAKNEPGKKKKNNQARCPASLQDRKLVVRGFAA